MRYSPLSIFSLTILLFVGTSIASDLPNSSLSDAGWYYLSENNFVEAENLFHEAISENKKNPRPYLALSYIMQLKEEQEKAWEWYETALKNLENPYPYIFASFFAKRGLLIADAAENRGLMTILPNLKDKTNADAILRAGSLAMMGRFHEQYGSLKVAKEYYRELHTIKKWTVIGPFENISASGFEKFFEPEIEYNSIKVYEGKNGIPTSWFKVKQIRTDRWIDFTRYFAQKESVFYGNTFVHVPEEQVAQIRVGTSGSLKAFLNDQLVISCFDENNNGLDTYIVETKLNKGWNRILIKCGYSEIAQCNFLVRITDQHGYNLQNLEVSTDPQIYSKNQDVPLKLIRNFAELFFEEQIKQYPDHFENYLLLSDCYLRNDKATEAELVLREAAAKMPDCVLIKNHLLEAFIRGERFDEIASTTAKIFELFPDVPFVLEQKFNEFDKNENLDQAEEIANRYSKLLPGSATAIIMQMNILFKKGQVPEALAKLNSAYEKYPSNWDIVYLSALFSIRTTQNYDGAIQIYKDFLKKRRTVDAFIQLGDTYFKASKVEKFEETFKSILNTDPAATGIYFTLAKVFIQLQNYKKAELYINECLDLCPNQSVYWSKLGEIHQASGNQDAAIYAYRKAVNYSATDYNSRNLLRELEGKNAIFSDFESANVDSLIKNASNADSYPRDGAVFLLDDKRRIVYHKGTSEIQNEILLKVFNSEGIDDFKEYWLPYNRYSEKLIIEKAVVFKLDGTEVKADIKNNQLVFKSLEPNECIYIKWRVQNYNKGRLSPHFWDEIHFNYYYPVEQIKYSLLLPKDFKFDHKTQNMSIIPTTKQTLDGIIYEWKLENQAALVSEYNAHDLDDIGKMLFISSIPNWEYLVDWYLDLAKTKTRSSYEIKDKVGELLSTNPDAKEDEKIELIYNFITENISYSSVSFRQSGLIPQKARDVLVQKIGDCKDVATLCIAMLKEAGIFAYYVLVNTFDEGQNKNILPALEFNHAIVGVKTEHGAIYMDLTARNYPLLTIPMSVQDAFALSILPGTKEPFYLSQNHFKPGLTKRTSTIEFQENNTAIINRKSEKWGTPAASFRGSYRFMGIDDQMREITEVLSKEFPNVQVSQFEIDDIDVVKQKITYSYKFSVPYYLVETSGMKLLKIPWADNLESRRSLSTEERQFDYLYRTNTDTLWEEMIIRLPRGFEPVELQEKISFESDMAEYIVEMQYKDSIITAHRRFTRKMKIISPQKYLEFKEFYNQAVRADAYQILLKRDK